MPQPVDDRPWYRRLSDIGIEDHDDSETRVRKRVLVVTTLLTVVVVTPWTIFYYAIGIPQAAAIPTSYILISIVLVVITARTGDDRTLRFSQMFMFLLLPPLVHIALGGFANSSAVAAYAAVAPIGAISYADSRHPGRWFAAFAAVIVLLIPFDSTLAERAPYVPPAVITTFFAVNIITTAMIATLALVAYVRNRNQLAAELATERERSERLLLNVLPESIAERLKNGERPIADRHEDVGVLFADIVDFTPLAETMTAAELVEGLNEIFNAFDELARSYGVEKVKTIGDAYMVISGAPDPGPDVATLARMALDMRRVATEADLGSRHGVRMRFGIDVGPLVAGVIGASRFIYDVYGDTVNSASRMESNGVADKIQVTRRVAERLDDRFVLVERGEIHVKGKGPTRTWFLEGARADVSSS